MRKQILLLVTIVLSTLSIAQIKPSFGLRAGLSSAGMRGDAVNNFKRLLDFTQDQITTSNRTGFFAGTYATIPLTSLLSLEPGVFYAQKGYELKGTLAVKGMDFLGANAKATLTTQYIDFPLLLKANIGGFRLFAGPQFSYLAQADLRTTAGVLGLNLVNTKIDATEGFTRWDAGITGGIGYQFVNGIQVTAAYDHGLSKIDAGKQLNSYNRSLKIGVGINF